MLRVSFVLFLVLLVGVAHAAEPPQIVPPKPLSTPPATLPEGTALEDHDVVLTLTIAADGTVAEAEVATGVGPPWDDAALAAARTFTFTPATADGVPIPVKVPFTYRFRALVKPPDPEPEPPKPEPPAPEKPRGDGYYAGTLVERGTRTPLAGVPVRVYDPKTSSVADAAEVLTDEQGDFVVEGLALGTLTLEVFTTGFALLETKVSVSAKSPREASDKRKTFYLNPTGEGVYKTSVKEDRPPKAASEVRLQNEELTKVPGTFGDPTRVVGSLPGVARSTFGLGYYVVRGAEVENTGFFIDGHPAGYLYHLFGGPGVVHPALIGDLSFYPGGAPAEFGRIAAGVIALETRDPPRDRWHLDIEADLFRAAVLFSVPFDDEKGVATFSFRRSYYEALLPLISDDVMIGFTDYQARVTYDFSPSVRARLVVLGALDFVEFAQDDAVEASSERTDLSTGFHRVNAAVEMDLSSCVTLSFSGLAEYDYTDIVSNSSERDTISFDTDGWVYQLISKLTWNPEKGRSLEVGLDTLYNTFAADIAVPITTVVGDPDPPEFDPVIVKSRIDSPYWGIAPFVSADLTFGPVRLLPGVRLNLDHYGDHIEATFDPRLAMRVKLDDQWTIKAMGALVHQAPGVGERIEPFGNPELPPVEGIQASLGGEWIPSKGWLVSLEGYVQLLDNLSGTTTDGADGEDLAGTRIVPNVEGRSYGLEVLVRKEFGGWIYGWLSYTLSRSERLRPPRDWTLFESDQTHVLNFAWTAQLGRGWSFGARFQLTSGNPYYRVVDARYNVDKDEFVPIFANQQSRLRVYHRLDVRLDKQWRFTTFLMELYLDIQNVYNATNPESPDYSFDYRLTKDGPSLPILPTLGLRLVF